MAKQLYRPRIADTTLGEKLEGIGAVLIEGPKWCGKPLLRNITQKVSYTWMIRRHELPIWRLPI